MFMLCVLLPFVGGWQSFGILGRGVLNRLEETWEERGYRVKRKEGGRAQCAVGISERNSFTLASTCITD